MLYVSRGMSPDSHKKDFAGARANGIALGSRIAVACGILRASVSNAESNCFSSLSMSAIARRGFRRTRSIRAVHSIAIVSYSNSTPFAGEA